MPKNLIRFTAAGFGSGYFPFAPGTVGTVAAMPLAWGLSLLPPVVAAALILLLVPVSAWLCGAAAETSGSKDPGWIVLDEFMGFFFASFLLVPTPAAYMAAFFLFRLFDIIKPPPANWLDRSNMGGWSILLDDIAAGIMTRLVLLAFGV